MIEEWVYSRIWWMFRYGITDDEDGKASGMEKIKH